MKFRSNFTKSPLTFVCSGDSLTRQEFEPECNINNILAKFKVTGVLVDPSRRSARTPLFGDFSEVPSFERYHQTMLRVSDEFNHLPDFVRMKFGNNVSEMVAWLGSNPSKADIASVFANPSKPAVSSGDFVKENVAEPVKNLEAEN